MRASSRWCRVSPSCCFISGSATGWWDARLSVFIRKKLFPACRASAAPYPCANFNFDDELNGTESENGNFPLDLKPGDKITVKAFSSANPFPGKPVCRIAEFLFRLPAAWRYCRLKKAARSCSKTRINQAFTRSILTTNRRRLSPCKDINLFLYPPNCLRARFQLEPSPSMWIRKSLPQRKYQQMKFRSFSREALLNFLLVIGPQPPAIPDPGGR